MASMPTSACCRPPSQRAALDAFGGIDLSALRAARARVTELDAELAALGGDERARARELDLARFQLAELDAAAIDDPDEEAALEALEDTLASAVEHRRAGALAYETLAGDGGGRDAVASAAAALAGRAPYQALVDRLAEVLAELDDIGSAVRDTAEQITDDPQRLEEVRARRQLLRELRRKYGDTLADVQRFHRDIAARVAELERYDERAGGHRCRTARGDRRRRSRGGGRARRPTRGGAEARRRRDGPPRSAGDAAAPWSTWRSSGSTTCSSCCRPTREPRCSR